MKQTQLNTSKICKHQKHSFHIVRSFPWPFLTFTILLNVVICLVLIFNQVLITEFWLEFSVIYFLSLTGGMWGYDVTNELHQHAHTILRAQRNFWYGFGIFLLMSEAMFFFGFFWCYFYMSLSPSIWIGCTWSSKGIIPINPMHLPLLNTILLVSSGVSVVFAHKAVMRVDGQKALMNSLAYSIGLGVPFIGGQLYEYRVAEFSINDGIAGSIFYVLFIFHYICVIIGIAALFVCLIRHYLHHFLRDHHIGLELTFWYWHFVDVIWILLCLFIYFVDDFDFVESNNNYFCTKILELLHYKLPVFFKNEYIVFFIIFNFLLTCILLFFFGNFLGKTKSLLLSYINVIFCMFLIIYFFFSVFFNDPNWAIRWEIEIFGIKFIEITIWKTNSLEFVLILIFHFFWHFFFFLVKDYSDLPKFLFYINFLITYSLLYNLTESIFVWLIGWFVYACNNELFDESYKSFKNKIETMKSRINDFFK